MARSAKTKIIPTPLRAGGARSKTPSPAAAATPKAKQPVKAATVVMPASAKAVTDPAPADATRRMGQPTKGELRTQIEKLEAANAALKAKSREANHTIKLARRRIAELEEQVVQRQEDTAEVAVPVPVAPVTKPKTVRRGRAASRIQVADTGIAVPPAVAAIDPEPEPVDVEVKTILSTLQEDPSGKQDS